MPVVLESRESFANRHLGPRAADLEAMLRVVGCPSLSALIDETVPSVIRSKRSLELPAARSEFELLRELGELARRNVVQRSLLGLGYHDTITPGVIQRNIFENPGWYTQYTPYQAEISQGRLEALLNFQTMVIELTGLPVANASLLDEATAAAEAMAMVQAQHEGGATAFFVSELCHPQTIEVVRTRAWPLGWEVIVGDHRTFDFKNKVFGALLQYPATDGAVHDYRAFIQGAHAAGVGVVLAADLLSLALLASPGELGADVAIGNTQRFGVPMGFGGPHAAYLAAQERFTRAMPGRIIGVSEDASGRPALRMALQTREQHIRREKATSNICTAQVLLAIMAGMYAVYHGPTGIRAIAQRVCGQARVLAAALKRLGFTIAHEQVFDTVRVESTPEKIAAVLGAAEARGLNFRRLGDRALCIALDECTTTAELESVVAAFRDRPGELSLGELAKTVSDEFPEPLRRKSAYLTHPVFNRYHSEHEMLRYIRMLERKDLSLTHSMIPLGSCTMKLNATAEMVPVSWPEFGRMHPFAPPTQTAGYQQLFKQLEAMLAEVTGLPGVSLQPNAGSQGEYAGLLVIRRYHELRGQKQRDVVLIPQSAHGTNPASAVMAGFRVEVVKTDDRGNIDLADLRAKAQEHATVLAALMVTYPSTHGVFEEGIRTACEVIHGHGGQVYMDGANMNAQVGLCRPGEFGADVLHLNLHKTFAIPHGGGGPGMGPIAVAAHLADLLPRHPLAGVGGERGIGPVSAAPWGSASILPISWMYISLMGAEGLRRATEVAILNANYIAQRLDPHYPVLYKGTKGRVAHECIVDLRPLKKSAGIEVEDVAKRLMDYGFHAPTVSFPVAGTMMIEPTESESLAELDRFCEAMISIRAEIREIEEGKAPRDSNLLKGAPHTAEVLLASEWNRSYERARAAYPVAGVRLNKFWPAVGRINNTLGDRRLVCSCPPLEDYASR